MVVQKVAVFSETTQKSSLILRLLRLLCQAVFDVKFHDKSSVDL